VAAAPSAPWPENNRRFEAKGLPERAFAGLSFHGGVPVPMRDGTLLSADVYRPDGDGPFPVLLMRQPYGRDIASTVVYAHPTWFARRGFIVVIQDVRGRGGSEGEFYPFRDDVADGFDTVAWAAGLPGSNGRVGMYGFSYQGLTQVAAAVSRPPALKAIAPHMTAFDPYSAWFYRDGIFKLSFALRWGNQILREDSRRTAAAAESGLDAAWLNPARLMNAFPLAELPLVQDSALPAYVADWLRHPRYDDYWRALDRLVRVAELGLPMFHVSGWYDWFLSGSIESYEAMSRSHPHQFLLASPWVHFPWGNRFGPENLGTAAEPGGEGSIDEMLVAWFHHWLDREVPAGAPPLAGCRYFVLGENAWRTAPAWPPEPANTEEWFLQSGGRANSRFGDGRLARGGAAGPDDLFNYDPEVPVEAPGGDRAGLVAFGPHDVAEQQQRLDLLVYTSAPLDAPTLVAGRPECVVYLCSSAPSTDLVVRLSRVTPDGRAQFISLGAIRCGLGSPPGEGTASGQPVELRIRLDPTAVRFAVGERIRLDLAGSAFPLLVRNPNTGADPVEVRTPGEFRRARQVIYHDASRPSRLILPALAA
jgi:putative CocE/NonD family hydrolase